MSVTFPVRWWFVISFSHEIEHQLSRSVFILLYCLNLVELHAGPAPIPCLKVFESRVEHVKEDLITKKTYLDKKCSKTYLRKFAAHYNNIRVCVEEE